MTVENKDKSVFDQLDVTVENKDKVILSGLDFKVFLTTSTACKCISIERILKMGFVLSFVHTIYI